MERTAYQVRWMQRGFGAPQLIGRWMKERLGGRIGLSLLGVLSAYHCRAGMRGVPYAKVRDPETVVLTPYSLVAIIFVSQVSLWFTKSTVLSVFAFLSSMLGFVFGTLVKMS